jgi:diketogulonate reductase-like aldo/keto reductase
MGALAAMKRRGFARHVGVANFNTAMLEDAIKLCPEPLTALQAEYHPFLNQAKILEACRRHKLAFISYCPLARGRIFSEPVLADIAAPRQAVPGRLAGSSSSRRSPPSSSSNPALAKNLDVFDFTLAMTRCAASALARPAAASSTPGPRAGLGWRRLISPRRQVPTSAPPCHRSRAPRRR